MMYRLVNKLIYIRANWLCVIASVVFLFSCRAQEKRSSPHVNQPHHTTVQDEWYADVSTDDHVLELKDVFNTYRDSIRVANVLKSSTHPMSSDDEFSRRVKLNKIEDRYDSKAFVVAFSRLAKSGDRQAEEWLLEFYNAYIDEAFKWNNSKSDGAGGRADLFLRPIDATIFKSMNSLPPSLRKADLFMRLYNVEPELYRHTSDVGAINADRAIYDVLRLMIFGENEKGLPSWYFKTHITKAHKEELNQEVNSLYVRIKSGTLKLVDRERWKTMDFIIVP